VPPGRLIPSHCGRRDHLLVAGTRSAIVDQQQRIFGRIVLNQFSQGITRQVDKRNDSNATLLPCSGDGAKGFVRCSVNDIESYLCFILNTSNRARMAALIDVATITVRRFSYSGTNVSKVRSVA